MISSTFWSTDYKYISQIIQNLAKLNLNISERMSHILKFLNMKHTLGE